MERNGHTLKTLAKGDRRRVADAKNAWRKASNAQRLEIAEWIVRGTGAPRLSMEVAAMLRKAAGVSG